MEIRKPNCACSECSLPIYRRPNQIEAGLVYCSPTCANVRNKKPDPDCVVCGQSIPRRKNAKTCSRKCSNTSRRGISYGIGRPNDKAENGNRLKTALLKVRPNKCNRCPFDLVPIIEVHHIIERCNGGTDEHDNLELLCPNCHTTHHYLTRTKMDD